MLTRLRERAGSEEGFTLVELLVVMLILGILAAIAIPSFFSQRDKARDADAKSDARTAQTAIETYATDNGGAYTDAAPADLVAIESTLTGVTLAVAGADAAAAPGADHYKVTVTEGTTGNAFSIERNSNGTTELTCTTGGSGGCPTGGDWSGS